MIIGAPDGIEIYYKVREVVRERGHSETESCRVFKDWHIELRVGSGHVSVWTSQGLVYLTMLEKPVHYKPGLWEEHLARLHMGRPVLKPAADLRDLLRAQAMENEEEIVSETEAEPVAGEQNGETELEAEKPEPGESTQSESNAVVAETHEPGNGSIHHAQPADSGSGSLQDGPPAPSSGPQSPSSQAADGDGIVAVSSGPTFARTKYVFSDEVILIDEDDD